MSEFWSLQETVIHEDFDASTEPLICDTVKCFRMAAPEQRINAVDFSSYYLHLNMTALFPGKFWPVRHLI